MKTQEVREDTVISSGFHSSLFWGLSSISHPPLVRLQAQYGAHHREAQARKREIGGAFQMVPIGAGYACEEGNLDLPACHQPLRAENADGLWAGSQTPEDQVGAPQRLLRPWT